MPLSQARKPGCATEGVTAVPRTALSHTTTPAVLPHATTMMNGTSPLSGWIHGSRRRPDAGPAEPTDRDQRRPTAYDYHYLLRTETQTVLRKKKRGLWVAPTLPPQRGRDTLRRYVLRSSRIVHTREKEGKRCDRTRAQAGINEMKKSRTERCAAQVSDPRNGRGRRGLTSRALRIRMLVNPMINETTDVSCRQMLGLRLRALVSLCPLPVLLRRIIADNADIT